uniref:Retrotrans_gag domain-containing protein n=1 Tax=Schistocephalus solidus TaxID=70667 RepID=A0A183TS60_SCHSO
LTRFTDFARWEARCKDYLQGLYAKARTGTILALLDDEVYDLTRSADIRFDSAKTVPNQQTYLYLYLNDLNTLAGESIDDFQQTLLLLGRRAFPTIDTKALNNRVLEQLDAGIRDPQIRRALLRDRPSTLEKALALAREEEILKAACEQPPRWLFGVRAVQPYSSHDAAIQTPWQPCSCGSFPRQNNWRRPQTRRPNRPQAHHTIEAI